MMMENIAVLLTFAFGLGLLHALDADHILAVSALSSDKSGFHNSTRYALRWSVGHGAILLAITVLIHWSVISMPAEVSALAEQLVGVVLIVLGLLVLYQIRSKRLHFHFHKHKNKTHAHWHPHDDQDIEKKNHQHEHKAFLIGGLHGLAGSAPLLAIIPLSEAKPISYSLLYLLVFSLGVFLAMISFGGLFGSLLKRLAEVSEKYVTTVKTLVAVLAISAGVHLVSA